MNGVHYCGAGKHGWPTTNILGGIPESDGDKEKIIDTIQDWKTQKYKDIISTCLFFASRRSRTSTTMQLHELLSQIKDEHFTIRCAIE